MSSLRIVTFSVCVSFVALCQPACDISEPGVTEPHVGKPNVEALKSVNEQEREKVAEAIRQQHQECVQGLIELAAEKVKPTPSRTTQDSEYIRHHSKHLAILILGDFRATEAVPVLLENLEYRNPNMLVVTTYPEEGQLYHAAGALSKIGMPAVGPTIKKLGSSAQKNKGGELCCWVLKKILGVKLARARLQIAIEETRDATVKKNLTAVLPCFKTEQEKAAEERARRQDD